MGTTRRLTFITLLLSSLGAAESAYANNCQPIGGVAMPIFSPQQDGTIRITAPLLGSVAATSGTVTQQRKTPTGMEMDMNHYFLNDSGGSFHTLDKAQLTAIPGKPNRFMIEIRYEIEPDSTTGTLKGFTGSFKSYGLVDLANFEGLVRYSGEICRS